MKLNAFTRIFLLFIILNASFIQAYISFSTFIIIKSSDLYFQQCIMVEYISRSY